LKIGALVAAAGEGLRMQNSTRKQYLLLDGIPVLARSVNLFLGRPDLDQVCVVVPPGEMARAGELLKPHCSTEKIELAEGGKTRQESVLRGLQALPDDCDLICIHDAARPLASGLLLQRLLEAALQFGAAVPVIRLSDTVKEVNATQMVIRTPMRENLRLVQTPQIFKAGLISLAYREAANKKWVATDDASLVERLGKPVAVVEGEPANLKITTAADLVLASWYLKGAAVK
jgi:2-C-methyl-D-erythritol 4-phosphate cytidylyltransferase